jgi:hypothetical protein
MGEVRVGHENFVSRAPLKALFFIFFNSIYTGKLRGEVFFLSRG